MLRIYNTITKQKEVFKPLRPGMVGMYVCGMTVYDFCHLGHARVLVCFDVIARFLRVSGFSVNYVRNITDIDDKIIARAEQNGESIQALTARFIEAMHEDERALHIEPPTKEPRATEFVPQMIAMIETLIQKGAAYVGANQDVYYDVSSFKTYGQLAHKDVDGQQAGARIEVVETKRHPLDFVLWKQAKPNEPSWDSPWGPGRPGWHIECSAMSTTCIAPHFDLHGGGFDLQFPHHENEIAQSEAATGEPFVNVWMHVGYLQVNREKMSKSLGNFFTIRDVLTQYAPEVVRYFLLSSHYRSQLNYSTENLETARAALSRLYLSIRGVALVDGVVSSDHEQRFTAAMEDDFNTPEALAVLFDLTRRINAARSDNKLEEAGQLATLLKRLSGILGILQQDPDIYLQLGAEENTESIEHLVLARNKARVEKNWAEADSLRKQLQDLQIEIEDKPDGTTLWRVKD